MQKIFNNILHKSVECYVDDLVVKSKKIIDHLQDLQKVFEWLLQYQFTMNSLKCAFRVTLGKFLEFIIKHHDSEID